MALRNRESIAGAVAREIDRIDLTGEHHGEGAAYKAAWDRKGSDWSKHCRAFTGDCNAMHSGAWRCRNCGFRGFWNDGPHCGPGSFDFIERAARARFLARNGVAA